MSAILDIGVENGGLVRLTLSNPAQRNPMSNALIEALLEAFANPDVQKASMVVIRGAGGHFCAGGDINDFADLFGASAAEQWEAGERFRRMLSELRALRAVTIAVVEGRALGGGCGLVASCDFAIASETATFGTPEIKLGAFPMVIVPPLVEALGPRMLLFLGTSGQSIGAAQALQCGLVQQVFAEAALEEGLAAITSMARPENASALRIGKACVWGAVGAPREAGLELGTAMRALLFSSPTFEAGVRAFLDRKTK